MLETQVVNGIGSIYSFFVQMGAHLALIDVLKALQWKHWHLLDTKQSKFIESSTLMFCRQNTQM